MITMSNEIMICRACQSDNIYSEWRPDREQYGIKCHDCNKYTWHPKEASKNRHAKHQELVKKKGVYYCEWCLRDKEFLPLPEILEGHHIIEYKDGGTDDLSNILVLCTKCHKQCHHDRVYLGHYKKMFNK